MPYFMRSTTKKKMGGRGEVDHAKAVMLDPFSLATSQPFIPDGKATMSVGQKLQARKEFQAGPDASQPMVFILFPGYGNSVTVWNNSESDSSIQNGTGSSSFLTSMLPYSKHGGWSFNYDFIQSQDATGSEAADIFNTATQNAEAFVSQWRQVSCGLHLSLTNNSDQNDGWWEAVRLTPSRDANLWCFANGSNATNPVLAKNGTVPTGPFDYAWPADGRICAKGLAWNDYVQGHFADNPSYISGKLRDIDKVKFVLNNIDTDRDFQSLKSNYIFLDNKINIVTDASVGYAGLRELPLDLVAAGANVSADGANVTDFVQSNLDYQYDIIVIKVWGRPSTSTGGGGVNTPTRILAHAVSNQELVYGENTFLERFMKKQPKAPGNLRGSNSQSAAKPASSSGQTSGWYNNHAGRRGMVRRPLTRRRITRRRFH